MSLITPEMKEELRRQDDDRSCYIIKMFLEQKDKDGNQVGTIHATQLQIDHISKNELIDTYYLMAVERMKDSLIHGVD